MKFKFLPFITFVLLFCGCSWQSVLTFGLVKSEAEILEQQAELELQANKVKCEKERNSVLCNNVAVAHSRLKDFNQAAKFYKLSCEQNLATACSNLGQIYEYGLIDDNKEPQKALAYYKLACASNDGVGCYNEAILLYTKDRQNFNHSLALFKKSCELDYKQACILLDNLRK